MRRTALVSLLVGLLLLIVVAPATAKRGGNGNGNKPPKFNSSITLDQPQPIHYGYTVTFSAQTTATDRPFVLLECSKSGVRVYSNTVGLFQDWYDEWGEPDSVLASLAWGGGDADCTASLFYMNSKWRKITLATTQFHVSG